MRKGDFDVIDTLLHDLSASTNVIEAKDDLTTCRDTNSGKECSCGDKPKPKPATAPNPKSKPKPKNTRRVRVVVNA